MKLTHRQRATVYAVAGLGAAPLITVHGARIFEPYILAGGYSAFFARAALFSLYFIVVRTILDLVLDAIDYMAGKYCTRGGEHSMIDQTRQNHFPYDRLNVPNIKRDFSNWQYAMFGASFFEIVIGWIACIGMLFAFFRSPYPGGSEHPFYLSRQAGSNHGMLWFLEVMSFLLVYFALYSIGYRRDLGLTPLIQRLLGVPDTYPGQNTFPPSVNEAAIRLIGRPM